MFNRQEYNKQYRLKNKKKIAERMLEWQRNNREKCHSYGKKWYQNNRERKNKQDREWSSKPENKVKRVGYVLKSREKNREKFLDYQKSFNKTLVGKYRLLKYRHFNKKYIGELMSFEDYKIESEKACVYCGGFNEKKGIDRIDNLLGYTKENSASCCSMCNMMKKNYNVEEFLSHIQRIYQNKFKNIKKSI